jgi:hypothetical protein
MSWNPFKSEEVTRVATSVSRVIEDSLVPDSVKTGLIKSVLQENNGNVSDFVLDELAQGIGVRAERLYRYAEDHYVWGMPSGEVYSSTQGRVDVEQTIEQQIEHQQVSIDYSHYGTANALHIGWTKLLAEHGYDVATNKLGVLSTAKGKDVYLKDMVVVVPTGQLSTTLPGRLARWGIAACAGYAPSRPAGGGLLAGLTPSSPINTSDAATEVHLLVTAEWKLDIPMSTPLNDPIWLDPYGRETFTISLSDYDLTANYFHAKYEVNGQTKYWMYKIYSGTYPRLDSVYVEKPAVNGAYFPFTYFRFNKASTNEDPLGETYKTSKKMVKFIGMDFDTVADAINANPSIGDVEQAIMVFGVPSVSTNPEENRYLFDYFDAQHAAVDGPVLMAESAVTESLNNNAGFATWSGDASTTVIQDQRFKMTLGNNGIFKHLVAGSIGEIDSYTSSYDTYTYTERIDSPDTETTPSYTYEYVVKLHRYRHQISKGVYEEILVRDLKMTYFIWGGYNTTGDGTSDILLVPIDRTITERYSLKAREVLYSRSLHLVFNSRATYEVKWYQQEWFRIALIVVAIILTVIDMGSDGGSWISGALGLTGTAAIVATVIFQIAVALVLPHVFRLFVKTFGQEAAEAFAIAAIIYGCYTLTTQGMAALPTAAEMLQMSTGLEGAVLEAKFADLQTDYAGLQEYERQQSALLEKANELLEKQTVLNPFVIFGEKPEDFYNRTIHTGNIGVLGINAVSSYVDIALTLPKIYDTLGEPING